MTERWRAYFELLRLPAVFTVVADVMMGYLVTHGDLEPPHVFALLVTASCCLYLAGMVLNDVYDADVDARERPERPIPSGRVTQDAACGLGWGLMAGGMSIACLTSLYVDDWRPGFLGSLLAGSILLYDGVLKRTVLAPIVMGSCRTLNVLLGMSLVTNARWPFELRNWTNSEWTIALGVGVYIAGVTWFARGEARASQRLQLVWGIVVMLSGLLMLETSGFMQLRPAHFVTEQGTWPMLWLGLALVILARCLWAVWRLEPRAVQIAVRNSLRALIVIDAAIVLGSCGPAWGGAVLALLAPMLLLERWFSTT